MADAIVSVVLQQLTSIISQEIQQEVRLVTGVSKEVDKLTSNFRAIQAVLLDAEQKGVKERAVRDWLDKLKDAAYDLDDVLDEWNTAILKLQIEGDHESALVPKKKVCHFLPSPKVCFKQVGLRRDIAIKIKEINENLDSIAKEKAMYNLDMIRSSEESQRFETTSFVDVSEVYGREQERIDLVSKLLSERKEEGKGLPIVSIVGMAGIGKTTLAQLVYNDEEVKSRFEKRIWVCVSEPFDEIRIAKAIIEGLDGCQAPDLVTFESFLNHICKSVVDKKFILVLDDVWTEDYNKWGPLYNSLNNGLRDSKILVTTRNERVACMMNSVDYINIGVLSNDKSWQLFKQLAFSGRSQQEGEKLEKIGREIVGKCKGLPLAIKIIGSLLRFKKTRDQWKRILDSEMWKLEELKDVFGSLLLSYNDLPSMVKRCFSYCAIFPKDYNIEKDELIKLWMAQGYLGSEQNENMEIIGEEYFDNLAMRSLFQEFEKDEEGNITGCKMHDIVHDFALFLVKKECFAMEIDSHEVPRLNPSYQTGRHSMLIVNNKEASFPRNKCSVQKLRSLLLRIVCGDNSVMRSELLQSSLFEQLTCLKALEISKSEFWFVNPMGSIPKEIGKLLHLRYLNLRKLGIEELPDTLCDLYNLQTLDLNGCKHLRKLPQEMGKLVNLRHLRIDGTRNLLYMPKGVERLTYLRTLSKLIIGVGGGDPGGSQVCSLGCLKNLNHLGGPLSLMGLRNVVDECEAKNAQLNKKENILHLTLFFNGVMRNDEAVLEALQLPPYLKELVIYDYGGIAFPTWIVSLTHLKEIRFLESNCEYLPPLGKLPCLEQLWISNMKRLKRVGNEFLGVEKNSSRPVIAFPKLKSLTFYENPEWEDWDYDVANDVVIMPSISYLCIGKCSKLKALQINNGSRPENLQPPLCLKTLEICDYRGIAFPDWMALSTQLKEIVLAGSFNCEYLPPLGKLPLLEKLEIHFMGRLKKVGNEFLGVENNRSSSSSSSSSSSFPKLKNLCFLGMKEWEEWDYENTKDVIMMPSLSSLRIIYCHKLKALPDRLLRASSLENLLIRDCHLLENWCKTEGIPFAH